jgi:glycine/D-amino acid oxidase-like deaminating enzyme
MKADIVVIGGGALGLSTALHCALPGRSVVVVERDTVGSGSAWMWPAPAASSIAAAQVVDVAGAWVRQVAELAGAGGGVAVAPVRHQLLITEPSPDLDPAEPITRVVDAAVYLRPPRGGLMVGGFGPTPMPVDPRVQHSSFRTDDLPLDLGVPRELAGQVAQEAPLAWSGRVAEHRGGLFTMSPDGRFVVGPVPGAPGLWVASGCNGSWFSSSPAIGEALASWIIAGTPPPA